jgi:hypothetical protein
LIHLNFLWEWRSHAIEFWEGERIRTGGGFSI